MNDKQLDCFMTTADMLSFSEASEKLFISQPAITYQIKMLEKELNVQLFERKLTKTTLTPAGLAFYEEAMKIKAAHEHAMKAMSPFQIKKAWVFGCPFVMLTQDNPNYSDLLRAFYQAFPDCDFTSKIVSGPPDNIKDLKEQNVDIMITYLPDSFIKDHQIGSQPLFHAKSYVLVNEKHPFAAMPFVSFEDLDGQHVYIIEEDQAFIPMVVNELKHYKQIHLQYEIKDLFETAIPLMEMGKGIAFTSISHHSYGRLIQVPLRLPRSYCIGLAWLRKNESEILKGMIQIVKEQQYNL